ncbi:MAG: PIN domain protein [Flavobacteriales bacterium]|nr:PIN domain protein [Flavobacteriales bacterium]
MRIYIDTSVFGGCFDEEFEEWSVKLFGLIAEGKYSVVISDVTEDELRDAPEHVRQVLKDVPRKRLEVMRLTDEARTLAQAYVKERIVTKKSKADTEHIAIATIAQVDLLVSWNFKHIVNYDRIRLYNAVNLKHGFRMLEIRSPRDLTT